MAQVGFLDFRLPSEEREGRIGLSYGGSCPRSLAYRREGYPQEPHPGLDPLRRRMALWVGQALHQAVRSAIADVRHPEREVALEVAPGLRVKGHIDGLVPDPRTGELRLLEIKTMSPYAWERLNRGGEVEEGYLIQVALYLEALKEEGEEVEEAVFLAVNKGDGSLHQRLLPYDPQHALRGKANLRMGLTLPPEQAPRAYGPDEEGRLPWQCVYCPFWRPCWPQAEPKAEGGKASLVLV